MNTMAIRQRLHQFIETAVERKLKAIYTILEDDIKEYEDKYTDEFKTEPDRRYNYYKAGGKMVSAVQSDKRIRTRHHPQTSNQQPVTSNLYPISHHLHSLPHSYFCAKLPE